MRVHVLSPVPWLGLLLGLLPAAAAPALECGETVSGTIATPSEFHDYPLALAAGDVVGVTIVQSGPTNFEALASLLSPTHQLVFFEDGACGPQQSCASAPVPVSGTYTLRIDDGGSNATGSYTLTVESLSGSWNGASNVPPSPACGAAADGMRAIGCGETVAGTIDVLGDSDTYSFVANAGDRVGLHGDVGLELFAPGGVRVGFDGGSPGCGAPCASDALPTTGVYTIRATRPSTGSYGLTLESLRASFAGGASTALCGTTPLACSETLAGSLTAPADSGTFSFFAEAGDVPWVISRNATGAADFGPRVERFAPDGSRLPETNDALPATGIYTLRVTDGGTTPADATGGYEISLIGEQLGGARCPRFPELSCGGSAGGALPSGGGQQFFSFTARAGDWASMGVVRDPTLAPIDAAVIGPDGGEPAMMFAHDLGHFPIVASGTHTVALVGGEGSYRVSLEAIAGRWNGGSNTAPTPICGAVADGTRTIRCGQTLSDSIEVRGDRDAYVFFAEAGDSVSVQVSPNGVGAPPFWVEPRLFAENALPVTLCSPGCQVSSIPSTGAYTVVVAAGPSTLQTGSYTVTLTRTPCASDCSDGVDNDGDGQTDTADGGCTSADDLSEHPECSDGRDNDGDGAFDFSGGDPGCTSPLGALEDPACDDGFDNDHDGTTDADGGGTGVADASCGGVAATAAESATSVGCGLGPELALALPLLAAARRCARGAASARSPGAR